MPLALLLAVGLASLAPELGARGGPLHTDWLVKVGVWLVFLGQGLSLSPAAWRQGLGQWRAHGFIQGWIFVAAPLLAWGLALLLGPWLGETGQLGLIFLGALPTTVASAIALTVAVRGDAALAVFNTALANLLCVGVTPLWMTLAGRMNPAGEAFGGLVLNLAGWILLPLALGVGLRLVGLTAPPGTRLFAQLVVVFLVYAAFANSFAEAVWAQQALGGLLASALGAVALLLLLTGATLASSRWIKEQNVRRATVLCASQKSLAVGVPLALALLGEQLSPGELGVVLVPLLVYHPLQLVLGALLVARWKGAA